jgi:hypothetical protein
MARLVLDSVYKQKFVPRWLAFGFTGGAVDLVARR